MNISCWFLQNMEAKAAVARLGGTTPGAAPGGGAPANRLQALIDTIIGNLELRISNVHLVYEDPVSNPGHSFSIGVLLQEVSAHTVDAGGKRVFVKSDALLTLRKVRLALISVQLTPKH